MAQSEQQNYRYTNYGDREGQPGGYNYSNYYYPPSPTKQELKAPLLGNDGFGSYQPPVYLPPGRTGAKGGDGGGSRVCAVIGTVVKLSVFHFFNAVLSITGCLLIHVAMDISIALLPLCCLGLLLYPTLFYFVGVFAKLDVKLYNFISPPSEHVYLDLQEDDNVFAFSWQSIAAAVYLCTAKVALGVLSSFVVAVNIFLLTLSVRLLVNSNNNNQRSTLQIGRHSIDVRRENVLVPAVGCVCALLVNIVLMHLFAKLSRASTRFFCCEKLSTYRYVNAA